MFISKVSIGILCCGRKQNLSHNWSMMKIQAILIVGGAVLHNGYVLLGVICRPH